MSNPSTFRVILLPLCNQHNSQSRKFRNLHLILKYLKLVAYILQINLKGDILLLVIIIKNSFHEFKQHFLAFNYSYPKILTDTLSETDLATLSPWILLCLSKCKIYVNFIFVYWNWMRRRERFKRDTLKYHSSKWM